MQINKTKTITRLFIISLITLATLTGCLEDPKGKPAHTIGKILGANADNILLDFSLTTLGGDGPYCLYFMPSKKIDSADINSVVQSFPYSVTVLKATENIMGFKAYCDMSLLETVGQRSKVPLKSFKLMQGVQPSTMGVPVTNWEIKRIVLGGISVNAYITQLEYTSSTAILQINDKLITQTLVVIGIQ